MTKEELIEFERDIGECFNQKMIRAPIHLYSGNEDQMIEIFNLVNKENDWVCCTWRNHYQCLLKGVPKELLKEKILEGKSMVMNLPEYKIVTSSIVGGIPSIAAGIAASCKLKGTLDHVWCFVGDMTAETGAFLEAYKYSCWHDLPITFIIEDNGLSVETPTQEAWGGKVPDWGNLPKIIYYQYKNTRYPHAGAGVRVQF